RLTAERNPDVEVVRALWDVGFRALPEPLAESTRRIDVESTHLAEQLARAGVDDSTDRGAAEGSAGGAASGRAAAGLVGEGDLAVARRFLRGATDGWEMATADLSGFPDRAAALGEVTAEMHLALARAFGA